MKCLLFLSVLAVLAFVGLAEIGEDEHPIGRRFWWFFLVSKNQHFIEILTNSDLNVRVWNSFVSFRDSFYCKFNLERICLVVLLQILIGNDHFTIIIVKFSIKIRRFATVLLQLWPKIQFSVILLQFCLQFWVL
jgi:hypothetical protein